MLSIQFGEMEHVAYGPVWFKHNYEPEWFTDPLIQEMVRDVDKTVYREGHVFDSETLGPIPPLSLSGGVKTLILIYKNPKIVFDATSCGQNCARWLVEIGRRKDVTINLRYFMNMDGLEPFEIMILNADRIVRSAEDYMLTALDYL